MRTLLQLVLMCTDELYAGLYLSETVQSTPWVPEQLYPQVKQEPDVLAFGDNPMTRRQNRRTKYYSLDGLHRIRCL